MRIDDLPEATGCPHCGVRTTCRVSDGPAAHPGDATICSGCLRVAIVTADGNKRRAGLEEVRDIQHEPGFVRAVAIAYAVQVLRKCRQDRRDPSPRASGR